MKNKNKKQTVLQELLEEIGGDIKNSFKSKPPEDIEDKPPAEKSIFYMYIHEDLLKNWETYWVRLSLIKLLSLIKKSKAKKRKHKI